MTQMNNLYRAIVKNSADLVTYRFLVVAKDRGQARDKVYEYLSRVNEIFTVDIERKIIDGELPEILN